MPGLHRVLVTGIPDSVGAAEAYDALRFHHGGASLVNALLLGAGTGGGHTGALLVDYADEASTKAATHPDTPLFVGGVAVTCRVLGLGPTCDPYAAGGGGDAAAASQSERSESDAAAHPVLVGIAVTRAEAGAPPVDAATVHALLERRLGSRLAPLSVATVAPGRRFNVLLHAVAANKLAQSVVPGTDGRLAPLGLLSGSRPNGQSDADVDTDAAAALALCAPWRSLDVEANFAEASAAEVVAAVAAVAQRTDGKFGAWRDEFGNLLCF